MAVNLPANIIIGAKTTSGFDTIGGKLMNMGSLISQFSDKILDFEKDSVEVYKNYETVMLEAEGALTTQYKSATQRARVMEELEAHVSEWAANSIFHTDDMAKAVSEAAHAGWSLEEMVEGIPVAMNLAQAGSLSLSEGLDDLIKTLNATGMGTEYASQLVDQWTMAANSSATTVGELGEALTKMGATARFADSTEELMAMLAVLADTGTVGTNAGTMLRNSMLRLVAPTTKAEDAMSLLGADVDELNDVLSDKSVTKAVKDLQGMGFSAYTSNGKLKPMIQIYKDLDKVLKGLDEASRNEILAAIFPTRTTTAALAFLDAANGKFDELTESMKDSEGYAGRIAEIQTSGLMGSTELLLSKEEELKRRVGDVLSEPIQRAQGFLGDVLDGLNAMPTEGLSALTGAATALGLAGPGMFVGGLAIKAIAAAGPWGRGFIVAAMGAGALAGYLTKISEINFESNFGTMELDMEALEKHIDGLKTKYDEEAKALDVWRDGVEKAQSTYETLTTEFSETLMTDALTGKKLTEKEKADLMAYGQGIGDALVEGLNNAQARDLTFMDMLIGNAESAEESEGIALGAELINARYGRLLEEAGALGEALRQQMSDAIGNDGIITEEERDEIINKTIEAMNQIQAEIDARMDAQRRWEAIGRAQNVSWDSMSGYMEYMEKSLTESLSGVDELYAGQYAKTMAEFDDAVKSGKPLKVNGEMITITEADRDKVAQPILDAWQRAKQAEYDLYGKEAATAINALMHDSAFGQYGIWDDLVADAQTDLDFRDFDLTGKSDAYLEQLQTLANQAAHYQNLLEPFSAYEGANYLLGIFDNLDILSQLAAQEVESRKRRESETPGGLDEYGNAASETIGESRNADELTLYMNDLVDTLNNHPWESVRETAEEYERAYQQMLDIGVSEDQIPTWFDREFYLEDLNEEAARREAQIAEHEREVQERRLQRMEERLEPEYTYTPAYSEYKSAEASVSQWANELAQLPAKGMDYISDLFRRPYLEEMLEVAEESLEKRAAALTEADQPGASEQDREIAEKQKELERLNSEMESADALIAQYEPWLNEGGIAGMCRRDQAEKLLYGEGGTIGLYESRENTQAQITQLQEELAAMQGAIDASGGVDVPVEATGGTEAMGTAMADMQRMGDQGVSVRLRTVGGAGAFVAEKYAEGGRATEPSIFAEGDTAEWAIPEEHTERTRQLLRQAAEASGFGWDELLSARGGLNSDAGNVTVNTTYAPTINAGDASGVEDVLNRDKARLAQVVREAVRAALADQRLRDQVEVYV